MLKKDAIAFAKQYGWTGKDAERAVMGLNLKLMSQSDLIEALLQFAGPELLERQRLQGAQKAQVTKKSNQLQQIQTEFADKVAQYEETMALERSQFVDVIARLYGFGNRFGLKDPWIETLLTQYAKYRTSA